MGLFSDLVDIANNVTGIVTKPIKKITKETKKAIEEIFDCDDKEK